MKASVPETEGRACFVTIQLLPFYHGYLSISDAKSKKIGQPQKKPQTPCIRRSYTEKQSYMERE